MAFPPINPMITHCKKCGWSHKQNSDAIQAFSSCPKCGSEELELSFAKGNPFESNPRQSASDRVFDKIKDLFKF